MKAFDQAMSATQEMLFTLKRGKLLGGLSEACKRILNAIHEARVMVRISGANMISPPPLVLTAQDFTSISGGLNEGFQQA